MVVTDKGSSWGSCGRTRRSACVARVYLLNRHRPETRKLDGWKVSIQAKNECKNKDKSMRNAR